MIFGKRDGFLFVVKNRGQVLAHRRIGESVNSVQLFGAIGGQKVIAAATDGELAFFDE